MKITEQQLQQIYPNSLKVNRDKYLPFINKYLDIYQVNTILRICHFLSQIGHESGELRYNEELASGKTYEGRVDLGNIEQGDGFKFKGRGLIQITGRSNYSELSEDFGADFINNPLLLKEPEWAVRSAFWFWDKKRLNLFADKDDIKTITKRINGGFNGFEDRKRIYELCRKYIV